MILRFLLGFLLLAATAQAGVLRVDCPESIGIGLPFMVRVESDEPMTQLRVEWGERVLDIPAQGASHVHFLLGTDVLKSRTGPETLRILRLGLRPLASTTTIMIENRKFPAQHLTVASEMATPPASVQARIAREQELVRAVLGRVTPVNHLDLPLVRPVPGGVSSAYGLKRVFNGQARNPHRGLDLRAATGDPIQAASPGQIVLAEEHYYGGRSVYIDHGLGVHTVYMHLDEMLVKEGDMVEAGQSIGRVGMTGRVTGPHLHFGLYVLDLALDPSKLFF